MRRVVLVLSLIVLTSCGGGSGGSTAPTPSAQAPTITTPNTMIFVGQTVQFSATGGSIRWGGDAPSVATIDQTTGRVTGVGTGRVTIWAENEGGRTTRLLRGLPSFAGNWQGNWVVQGCTENGIFAVLHTCRSFPSGGSRSLGMTINQTDDRITGGGLAFGALTGPITPSTVAENGEVRLTAAMDPLPNNAFRVGAENVVLSSPTAGNIQGSLEQVWSNTDFSGTLRVNARIANLTRTAGGPTLSMKRSNLDAPTLEDLIRLMR
jgi:hypothetical protein